MTYSRPGSGNAPKPGAQINGARSVVQPAANPSVVVERGDTELRIGRVEHLRGALVRATPGFEPFFVRGAEEHQQRRARVVMGAHPSQIQTYRRMVHEIPQVAFPTAVVVGQEHEPLV